MNPGGVLFNVWDWLISGFLALLDALLVPMFDLVTTVASGGLPHDASLAIYFRAAIRVVYPIVSVLNLLPFVVAVAPSLAIGLVRKLFAAYQFITDMIPVTR